MKKNWKYFAGGNPQENCGKKDPFGAFLVQTDNYENYPRRPKKNGNQLKKNEHSHACQKLLVLDWGTSLSLQHC